MKTFALLLALLIAPLSLAAEKSLVDFTGQPGKYLVTVNANGTMSVEKVTIIKVGGPVVPPVDPPIDPPVDPVLTPRATAIRDAAAKATADTTRDKTAMELSVLYGEIAKRIKSGEIKGQDAIAFIAKTAADTIINKTNAPTAWKPARDALGAQWTKLAQEGGKDADYAKLLEEASAGLAASISLPQAFNLAEILELIKLILDLISKLPIRP
jgi:hypothetical protein